MAYKRGDPLVNRNKLFRIFSFLTYQAVVLPVRCIGSFFYGLKVKNRWRLARIKPSLLVSNHTLFIDPGIIGQAIRPRRSFYTLLEETCTAPYLGTLVRLLGGIPVPRGKNGIPRLEDGIRLALSVSPHVHFFPEGECYVWNQEIRKFRAGAFYFSAKLGIPVLPLVTVLRERRFLGKPYVLLFGRKILVPPQVTIVVGAPFYPANYVSHNDIPDMTEVRRYAEAVRTSMQETIDREGGSKALFRGRMPRIAGINAA